MFYMIDAKEKYMSAIFNYLSNLNISESYNLNANRELFDIINNFTFYNAYCKNNNIYKPNNLDAVYYLFDSDIALIDSKVSFTDLDGNNHNATLICLNKANVDFPLVNIITEKYTDENNNVLDKFVCLINNDSGFYYEKISNNESNIPLCEKYSSISLSKNDNDVNLANLLLGRNVYPYEIKYIYGVPVLQNSDSNLNPQEFIDQINKKIDASLKYINFEVGYSKNLVLD